MTLKLSMEKKKAFSKIAQRNQCSVTAHRCFLFFFYPPFLDTYQSDNLTLSIEKKDFLSVSKKLRIKQ